MTETGATEEVLVDITADTLEHAIAKSFSTAREEQRLFLRRGSDLLARGPLTIRFVGMLLDVRECDGRSPTWTFAITYSPWKVRKAGYFPSGGER